MKKRLQFLGLRIIGDDPKMRRLVRYWGGIALLYLLCIAILWIEALSGAAKMRTAAFFTGGAILGHLLFYLLIRFSRQLDLTPEQLSIYQGRFAVLCTVTGYVIIGPMRSATLLVLIVILVFCAFTLEARKSHSLSVFAVTLLGIAMIGLVNLHPGEVNALHELKQFVLVGVMVAVVGFLTGRMSELRAALKAQKAGLADALVQIQELATKDDLTMLPNRRHMSALIRAHGTTRGATPACLALLDLDSFKQINDQYGHAIGDEVLCEFAQQSRLALRGNDVFARWGGEEFLLYLPDATKRAAELVLQRLQECVDRLQFSKDGRYFGVSFSAGLVQMRLGETIDSAVARADALLYIAKAAGRNRVMSELEAC